LRTLHLYLTKQVLLTLMMTVAVFTFVLLVGNVLKEIIGLLVAGKVSPGLVLKAMGLLVPYVMAYVLPFATLTAVILVFGRFSADQELTAVRASGISLVSLITPVLFLSLALCGFCALFNMWVAPKCRGAYKNIIFELGSRTIGNLISEDRFIDEIPGVVLYIHKKHGDEMEDVRLYMLEKNQINKRISARSGTILYDSAAQKIRFRLVDVLTEVRMDPAEQENIIGPPLPEKPAEWQPATAGSYDMDPIDLAALMKNERKPKLAEMTFAQLKQERRDLEERGIESMPVLVQIHRQVSFAFACFSFTLVGIPLAIQAHRRETSIGVAISLGLVLCYYAFFLLGEALGTKERFHPNLILWVPNFLFQALGAVLLARASHG
jgi:lipopolysaccharide export system permease protein